MLLLRYTLIVSINLVNCLTCFYYNAYAIYQQMQCCTNTTPQLDHLSCELPRHRLSIYRLLSSGCCILKHTSYHGIRACLGGLSLPPGIVIWCVLEYPVLPQDMIELYSTQESYYVYFRYTFMYPVRPFEILMISGTRYPQHFD